MEKINFRKLQDLAKVCICHIGIPLQYTNMVAIKPIFFFSSIEIIVCDI